MDAHDHQPHIAIAASDRAQRLEIASGLTSFYRFAEYKDISEALAGCRARPPVLVLVSEHLPLTGGFDLVRMLRLDPRLAAIPAVVVVAKDDAPTRAPASGDAVPRDSSPPRSTVGHSSPPSPA